MNKKGLLNLLDKRLKEINDILKEGARIKVFDGANILEVLDENRNSFLKYEEGFAPNSLYLDYMAKYGFEFIQNSNGDIKTDDLIYIDFDRGVKKETDKINAVIKNIEKDIEKLKADKEEILKLKEDEELLVEIEDINKKINVANKNKNNQIKKIEKIDEKIQNATTNSMRKSLREQKKSLIDKKNEYENTEKELKAQKNELNKQVGKKQSALESVEKDLQYSQNRWANKREELGYSYKRDEEGYLVRDEKGELIELGFEEAVDESESLSMLDTRKKLYREGVYIKRTEYAEPLKSKLALKNVEINELHKAKASPKTIAKATKEKEELLKKYDDCIDVYYDHYKISYQSSAKSRLGNTLGIRDMVYGADKKTVIVNKKESVAKLESKMTLGISDLINNNPTGEFDIVSVQAYGALVQSATAMKDDKTLMVEIDPSKEMLILKDVDCVVKGKGIKIGKKQGADLMEILEEGTVDLKNTLFDGQSIVDASLLKGVSDSSMVLTRNVMYKSALFPANLQDYFKDYYKKHSKKGGKYEGLKYEDVTVVDMFGVERKLCDIKFISTDNSFKWLKFAETKHPNADNPQLEMFKDFIESCKEDDNLFSIVKFAKSSKFGQKQRMSYQMLNTIRFSEDPKEASKQLAKVLQDTFEYAEKLRTDDSAFLDYVEHVLGEDEYILELIKVNGELLNTTAINDIRNTIIGDIYKNARKGKILVDAGNKTIIGNPVEMVKYALGDLPVVNGKLDLDAFKNSFKSDGRYVNVYCKGYEDGKLLLSMRSPHSAPSGCVLLKHQEVGEIKKLFGDNIDENIVCVDLTVFPVQDCWNGSDQDSDFVFTTDNEGLVEAVDKNSWLKEVIPQNSVPMEKKRYKGNEKYLVDYALSSNTIGETTNLSQIAFSQIEELTRNKKYYIKKFGETEYNKKVEGLSQIVYELTVGANISIDNSKRKYELDVVKYLKDVKKRDCWLKVDEDNIKELMALKINQGRNIKVGQIIRPTFFKDITSNKDIPLQKMSCIMDMTAEAKELKGKSTTKKRNLTDIADLLDGTKIDKERVSKKNLDKAYDIIAKYDGEIRGLRARMNLANADEDRLRDLIRLQKENLVDELRDLKMNTSTFRALMKEAVTDGKLKSYRRLTLEALYDVDNTKYTGTFKKGVSRPTNSELEGVATDGVIQYSNNNLPVQKEINEMHDETYKEIKANVDEINKKFLNQELTKEEAFEEVDKILKSSMKDLGTEVTGVMKKHFAETMAFGYYNTLFQTSRSFDIVVSFDSIPKRAIESALKEPFAGGIFEDRVMKNMSETLKDELRNIITTGMEEGHTLWKMSQDMKEMMGYSQKDCERILRTETNHFYNSGTLTAYQELQVEKYVFLATLDTRTSKKCQELDLKTFTVDEAQTGVNLPPMHPNCRSTTMMYVDDEWLKSLDRRARDNRGKGILIKNMDYAEWYKTYIDKK